MSFFYLVLTLYINRQFPSCETNFKTNDNNMRRQQFNLLITSLLLCSWSFVVTQADPETHLINKGCSQYNATNLSNFYQNLNTTLSDLKSQVGNKNKHFATAQLARGENPVYALFQCRNYLSNSDCSACFQVAAAQIRNCSAGSNGARVIYDGCFLRYNSTYYFINYIIIIIMIRLAYQVMHFTFTFTFTFTRTQAHNNYY